MSTHARGQALIELAMSILLLLLVSFGIIEFGRSLMIANMVTHAARHGARAAAVEPSSNRNTSGMLVSTSAIVTQVRDQIAQVVGTTAANQFNITVTQTNTGTPMVNVRVVGSVPQIFGTLLFTNGSLAIDRTVAFRDEGR